MIELKHLQLLQAIERAGTISGAARSLGYSQPAATQQLRLLERRMHTPIVVRRGRKLEFTAAGRVLLGHAETMLSMAALAEVEVEAIAGLQAGRIRLACFSSAAATILPHALTTLGETYPGLTVTLIEGDTRLGLKALRSGDVDIAIVYHYEHDGEDTPLKLQSGERGHELLTEQAWIALPANHELVDAPELAFQDLKQEPWVGCAACRANLITMQSDFDPQIGFETENYIAMQRLVGAGVGVGLVTDLMCLSTRTEAELVLRAITPPLRRIVTAVVAEPLLESPGVRETLAALSAAAAKTAESIAQLSPLAIA